MKAAIYLDVPEWQIGQEASVYFPDSMVAHGKCEELTKEQVTGYWNIRLNPFNKKLFYFCPNCGIRMKSEKTIISKS